MPQILLRPNGTQCDSFELPDPETPIMRGVVWGRHDVLFTPAYWKSQVCLNEPMARLHDFRMGRTLCEEVAVCLLGGHGIPAEVGLAAFRRLRGSGLLTGAPVTTSAIADALSEPLLVQERRYRYRFVRQKSEYLADAIQMLADSTPPMKPDRAFRDWLLRLPGVGPKTASWITRNWLGSDKVAIIDIHIHRAGIIAGLFPASSSINRDYLRLEALFLDFCRRIEVRPAYLDTLIWQQMKEAGNLARCIYENLLHNHTSAAKLRKVA